MSVIDQVAAWVEGANLGLVLALGILVWMRLGKRRLHASRARIRPLAGRSRRVP